FRVSDLDRLEERWQVNSGLELVLVPLRLGRLQRNCCVECSGAKGIERCFQRSPRRSRGGCVISICLCYLELRLPDGSQLGGPAVQVLTVQQFCVRSKNALQLGAG